jgi:3-oxoacyl-[acyl-carrier-protein] synthase-3
MVAAELLARREALVANGLLMPPDQWATLPVEEQKLHRGRWEQFETNDQWIVERTGIAERRIAAPEIATSDLAIVAAREAMKVAGWQSEMVNGVYIATVTPDHPLTPPTFSLVQHGLGIPAYDADGRPRNIGGIDGSAACSSFGQVLRAAHDWTSSVEHGVRRTLVIGADVVSRWVDSNSRNLIPILADGGGALAIESTSDAEGCFFGDRSFFGGTDGSLADLIKVPAGGSRQPSGSTAMPDDLFNPAGRMIMDGRAVMKQAVRILLGDKVHGLQGFMEASLAQAGIDITEVDFVAMHQANQRITNATEDRLRNSGFRGVIYQNIQRYANTTSGTIPLVLYDAWVEGILKPGMLVWLVVFGGGFTAHLTLFRWTLPSPALAA